MTIPLRRKLSYSIVVTVTAVVTIEATCHLVFHVPASDRWGQHTNLVVTIGFDGLNEILQSDAERFWRLKPNTALRLEGEITDSGPMSFFVSTDDHGHRRTKEVAGARHTVLFLGDSCTFGVGVDDHQTFASLLQDRLPATRCVNAGVPGYSAYQGRKVLESLSIEERPDVVVVSFLFNDNSHWDQLSDLEHAAALNSLSAMLVRHSRFATLISTFSGHRAAVSKRPKRPRLTDEEYLDELEKIVENCRQTGMGTIFLVWPLRRQMPSGPAFTKQDVMRYVAGQHGIPVVDLVPVFQQAGGIGLFTDSVHANAAGHKVVADRLESLLREYCEPVD